jgi:hypothetical protein
MDPVIILIKRPADWEVPWEASLVPHEKDSRHRRLPTVAAKDKVLCGGYNEAMLPKCKGKKSLPAGLTFSLFKARL